jgi:drug/metabolite transporter (DMT)-like permease
MAALNPSGIFMPPAKASSSSALLKVAPVVFLLLWSAGFPVSKIALEHSQPLGLLAMRYALTAAVLVVLYAAMRPALPKGRAWLHVAVVGFFIQVMYFGLSYLSLDMGTSAGVLALITSLQPVLVSALAPKLVGERVSPQRWLGLALGLLGAAGVIAARSSIESDSIVGILLAFGALLGMTAAMLYEKRSGTEVHPVSANLVQYAVGLAVCAPVAWATDQFHYNWTWGLIGPLAYLVLANSLIAISLLLALTRAGEVSRVSSLFFFVPPLAAILSMMLLGEAMPPLAWAAMLISVAGVAIATRPDKAKRAS